MVLFIDTTPKSIECKFEYGDGYGPSEHKIEGKTGTDCVLACVEWKKTNDNTVNGVTILANNNPGLYTLFFI